MDYWERLKVLQMYSQERRHERYMIIFLWKLSQGLVKGYRVNFSNHERRGRIIVPHTTVGSSPAAVRQAREASLEVKGVQICNLLPGTIRNLDSQHVETFKTNMDALLAKVPDQPTVGGQTRAAKSKSLLHQIPMMVANSIN